MHASYYLVIHNSNNVPRLCLAYLLVTDIMSIFVKKKYPDFFLHKKKNSVQNGQIDATNSIAKELSITWLALNHGYPPLKPNMTPIHSLTCVDVHM